MPEELFLQPFSQGVVSAFFVLQHEEQMYQFFPPVKVELRLKSNVMLIISFML
jgi:hypothetical protein